MIGLSMIVKNESAFIVQCLQPLIDSGYLDEAVVVDTGSTDDTVELAASCGADVYSFDWCDDFAQARNYALSLMSSKWVLVLDADEELSPEALQSIRAYLLNNPEPSLYSLKIDNLAENQAETTSHYLTRLFPNLPGAQWAGKIHEQIVIPNIERKFIAGVEVIHHGYKREVMNQRGKLERNTAMLRSAIENEPGNPFHWFNAGLNYRAHKEYAQAIEAFKKCLILNDRKNEQPLYLPMAYNCIIDVFNLMGAHEDARLFALSAPNYCKATPEYWVSLGHALLKLEHYEDSITAYASALNCDPSVHFRENSAATWKPWSGMGSAYLKLSDYNRAAQCYRKAREMNPENQSLSRALRKTERLKMLVRH